MAHKTVLKTETLTGTRTLTAAEGVKYYAFHLDPGGADRTVVMPSETLLSGHAVVLANTADGTEYLTVVASDTTTVVGYLAPGDRAEFICSGTLWSARDRRRGLVLTETLAGARVLTGAEVLKTAVMALDPGGASRNVDLPATSYLLAGVQVTLINTADAAETLTVRLTGGGSTVATVDQNEHVILTCYSATAGSWVGSVSKAT